jgi:rSAM/selenodomain-associated transferase 1
MKQRLLLFAKRPRRGKVKTRLCPPLRPQEALGLYRAFLADQLRLLEAFRDRCQVELTVDGPWEAGDGERPAFEGLRWGEQGPGDLGLRLLRAFSRSRAEGCGQTVVVGADSPTLPYDHVRRALAELRAGAPGVIAAARDGGYVLLGLGDPVPALFEGIAWSGPDVFTATCRRAARHGIELVRLEPWHDVDDARGLERLRRELARAATRRRAPATARFLDRLDARRRRVV